MTTNAERILGGFTASGIERAPVPLLYRSGMILVLIGMVLLPVAYLALVAFAAYLTWLWATNGLMIFSSGSAGLIKLVIYLVPLAAGCALVFFMFKPLFSRTSDEYQPFVLNEGEEPGLAEFARRIATIVGAPTPIQIELNSDVNASASFEGGFFGMLSKALKLTIGLPLIEGMTTRSLAGVIAHEMGHFSQGSGMRVSYLIRLINNWFARVVYERDKWDVMLHNWKTSGGHWAVQLAGVVAEWAVKAGRYALLGLMKVGHAISCFMLRQMEYDADSMEAKVAGSDHFAYTSDRLCRLGLGGMKARAFLQHAWEEKLLPYNIAGYIVHHAVSLTDEEERRANEQEPKEEPHWYDTHPTASQRKERVEASFEPGVFHIEEPATSLCAHYKRLAKAVTSHHYVHELKLPMDRVSLVDVNELTSGDRMGERSQPICKKFFGRQLYLSRPLGLPSPLEGDESALELQRRLIEARNRMQAALEATASAHGRDEENDGKLIQLYGLLALVKAGFKIKSDLFTVANPKEDDVELQLGATKLQADRLQREQGQYLAAAQECFDLAVRLAMKGQNAAFLSSCANPMASYREIGLKYHSELRRLLISANALLGPVQDPRFAATVLPQLEELTVQLTDILRLIRELFVDQVFPFEHSKGKMSIQDYLRVDEDKEAHRVFQIYHEAEVVAMRYGTLYFRLLAVFIEEAGEFQPMGQGSKAEKVLHSSHT